jgi:transcription antitermination factor NusG
MSRLHVESNIRNLEKHWYPIRVTYGREQKLCEWIRTHEGMEVFLPERLVETEVHGKPVQRRIPAVRNLLFIYADRSMLDQLRARLRLRIPFHPILIPGSTKPLTVSDEAMHQFKLACTLPDTETVYLNTAEPALKRGDRVRVTNGPWTGLEGELIRISGTRHLVVSLPGLLSVATAHIPSDCIEKV